MYEPIRAQVIVKGRVQKVFFRANTVDEARDLGLTGWVKNNKDGTVEAVFEGPRNKVDEIILWCKDGPRLAKVEDIQIKYGKYTGEFTSFEIVRI